MKNKLNVGKQILQVVAREVTGSLIAANLYPLGLLQKIRAKEEIPSYPPHTSTQNKTSYNRPVLLVHGIAHNASAFIRMKNQMEQQGWIHVFTMNYDTFNRNILTMVEQLSKQVNKVMEVTQASQIDIVAHSLGGIVSRYYMSVGEGRDKVRNLVTLGSSHQGTYLSPLLRPFALNKRLSRDLYIDSPFLKTLQQTQISESSTITSIYSKYDWTVWPQSSSFAEGLPSHAFKNIQVDFVSHIGLLYSSRVLKHIVKTLKY